MSEHPLNAAIDAVRAAAEPGLAQKFAEYSYALMLRDTSLVAANSIYHFSRRLTLKDLALMCSYWLAEIDVADPWAAMHDAYDRAHAGEDYTGLDSDWITDEERYFVLIEQLGKVAGALAYSMSRLLTQQEVTKLGTLALEWLTRELNSDKGRDA